MSLSLETINRVICKIANERNMIGSVCVVYVYNCGACEWCVLNYSRLRFLNWYKNRNNLFQFLSSPFHLRCTVDEVCNKYYILHNIRPTFYENIKCSNFMAYIKCSNQYQLRWRLYFGGECISWGGEENSTRVYPPGERKYFLSPVTL